jgi:hypothetical protein
MFLTSRFTTDTYLENKRYREAHNIPCIYNPAIPISDRHPPGKCLVLEMNITTNKLIGIGIIQKQLQSNARIYKDPSYNRYTYRGNHYIPVEQIPPSIVQDLEQKLFYGKSHMKRGMGLTKYPDKWLTPELISLVHTQGLQLHPIL